MAQVNALSQGDLAHDLGLVAGNRETGDLLRSLHKPLFAQIMTRDQATTPKTTTKSDDGDKEEDHLASFARQMGQERFDQIMDFNYVAVYKCKILHHGDLLGVRLTM
jgi:hypothetical protein